MSIVTRLAPYMKWRYFLYLFAMVAGWPCVFSFMGWLPDWKINYIVLSVLSLLTILFGQSKKLPSPIMKIILIQLITFVLYYAMYLDTSYITRAFYLVTTYALLAIQMAQPKTEFVDTNVSFLTVQALMGAVGFMLYLTGILPEICTFREFDGHTGHFYGLFTTTVSTGRLVRVAGFFDEPGAFAFWGIVALLFNKLFIKNQKIEIVLVIGLVSTLSMAYIIQVALYILLFYNARMSKMFVYGVMFIILLLVVASISPEFNDAIFGRFQINAETGKLKGDNRTDLASGCLAIWQSSPLFGVGGNDMIAIANRTGKFVGANAFTFLAMDGIVGQFVLWLPLFYLFSLGEYRIEYRYAAIIIFAGFMQRPYDPTQLWYTLTMYMLIIEAYREIHDYPGVNRSNIQCTNFSHSET